VATIEEVRAYWDRQVHDAKITQHPVGSRGFFDDLDRYHFEKLHYLLRLVDFDGYRGRTVLDVGCGAGVDLARFAKVAPTSPASTSPPPSSRSPAPISPNRTCTGISRSPTRATPVCRQCL
jgi:hypothetical protein